MIVARFRSCLPTVTAVLVLATSAGVALAARPKAGARFKGSITDSRYRLNGYPPPVTFTVGSTRTTLRRFTFGSTGCSGGGGGGSGNPWRGLFLIHAGTMRVSSTGSVAQVKVVRFPIRGAGPSGRTETTTLTTRVTIKGRFATARRITGTIAIAQSFRFSFQRQAQRCAGVPESFTAKAR